MHPMWLEHCIKKKNTRNRPPESANIEGVVAIFSGIVSDFFLNVNNIFLFYRIQEKNSILLGKNANSPINIQ